MNELLVFRNKTKSNEILHPSERVKGKNVWVADTIDGERKKYVCLDIGIEPIPLADYLELKRKSKEENYRKNARICRRAVLLRSEDGHGLQPFFATD